MAFHWKTDSSQRDRNYESFPEGDKASVGRQWSDAEQGKSISNMVVV